MGQALLGYDPWNDYLIRGTGIAALDNAEFAKAVATMNARGKGSIVIDRTCVINSFHNLLAPIGLRGKDNGAILRTSGASAWVAWGGFSYPFTNLSAAALTAAPAGQSFIVSPNLTLAENDYVAVWSFNQSPGITAHNPETIYYPMEILRISQAVTGSANTWRFADMIDDPLTTTPRIAKLSMIRGVRVADLRMEHNAGSGSVGTNLRFGFCADLRIENVTFGWPNNGQLGLSMCHGVQISGMRIEDAEDYNAAGLGTGGSPVKYGIVVGSSHEVQIEHCLIQNVRHPLTTGAIDWYRPWVAGETVAVGDYRWSTAVSPARAYKCTVAGTTTSTAPSHTGLTTASNAPSSGPSYGVTWQDLGTDRGVYRFGTVKNLTFRNNICKNNAFQPTAGNPAYSGMTCVDTHSEGRHIVIEGNKIIVTGEAQNTGISIRSRDTIVRNNVIECGVQAVGIAIVGANCIVENNTIDGGFYSEVSVPNFNSPSNVDNVIWRKNTFRNTFGPGLRIMSGTGHEIYGNTFENCAYNYASNSPVKACIWIGGLTDSNSRIDIHSNIIPKRTNVFGDTNYRNDMPIAWADTVNANQVRATNNVCDGYGQNSHGIISPYWRANESVVYLDIRRNGNNEYRWVAATGSVGATAPTHTSGTTNNWAFSRAITGSKLAEWEATYGWMNREIKFSVVRADSHTLTTAHKGYTINTSFGPLDDANAGQATDGRVLIDVIDGDYIMVAEPGQTIELPPAIIAQSYSIAANGRNLYFDLSANGYKATNAGHVDNPVVLNVTAYTSNFLQVKLPVASGGAPSGGTAYYDMTVAIGDETSNLSVGESKLTFRAPRAITSLTGVKASLTEAATGSTFIVDINVGGSSILSTKLSINAGATTSVGASSAAVLTASSIADNAVITIDIDQVGSTNPGKGLKVSFLGTA